MDLKLIGSKDTTMRRKSRERGSFWSRLHRRDTLKRVTANSAWLAGDNVFRLITAFVVGAWVARHLGPERFGILSFSVAFCAPFGVLISLGLNAIVVRDLVRHPEASPEILGTTLGLKLAGALIALSSCGIAALAAGSIDARAFSLVLVVTGGMAFQSGDVFNLSLQSQGLARHSAWARSAASIGASLARIVMIVGDAPLIWFAAVIGLEAILCAIGWVMFLRRSALGSRWRFSSSRAAGLLRDCWPVLAGGIAIQIQAHFDQVLLAGMGDPTDVGHYSAALRLVAVFGFIPVAVQTAAAPEVTRAHVVDRNLYLRRICHLYRLLLAAFVAVAVPLAVFSGPIVQTVFGADYTASAALLPLLTIRILLTNIGVVRSMYLTNEGLLRHSMVTSLIGAAVNLALNLALIPRWGALGCVVSALISFSITTVALECFQPKARINLRVMVSAVTFRPLPS